MKYRKALRPRTIIPDELYVDRDADRQLNDVIDEMGRPGYILVARQMGKTNLLLRMKRKRERDGELAIYIDLSIGFTDARSLFHHLIDSLLEAVPLDDLQKVIEKDRQNSTLDASVEYDRHLRKFLSAVQKERVIIILDEIDSLVGQPYSDRILSQVRSMYFARANFPIYESLTYVLSGVAEPTDLIKDKNISPFNIGEKIYLSDFSRSEVSSLLKKAGVKFDLSVQESVYDWVNGNPRMTWDVYSALEDAVIAEEAVDVSSVDAVIQKLYLTRYDRAPLDHIRALAENEPEVRAALVSLLYGKGSTLDDRSRSKLYLAGITTASANEAPAIKNKVIEHALSETWLAQVEAGRKGLVAAAIRRYSSADYSEAVELFAQYMASGGSVDSLDDIETMQYGMSLYHTGSYEHSLEVLELASKNTRSSEVRHALTYYMGLATMMLDRPEQAIGIFEGLAHTSGAYKLRALHAVGTAYLKMSIIDNAEKILSLNSDVIDQTQSDEDLTEDVKSELISAAYYNIGQVYSSSDRLSQAKDAFEAANASASIKMKPAFASVRLRAAETDGEREAIIEEVKDALRREPIPYVINRGTLGFDERDMAELLAEAINLRLWDTFGVLLEEACARSLQGSFETLSGLAIASDWQEDSSVMRTLLRHALTSSDIAREALLEQKLKAATAWIGRADEADHGAAFEAYWSLASEPAALEFLTANDTVMFANQISDDLSSGNLTRAKKIMSFVRSNEAALTAASSAMFAFFVYQEMIVYRTEANYAKCLQAAQEVISLVEASKKKNDASFIRYAALVERLRTAAVRELSAFAPSKPKFGRNEFVTVVDKHSGAKSRVKFKKVAHLLENGSLEIVDDVNVGSRDVNTIIAKQ